MSSYPRPPQASQGNRPPPMRGPPPPTRRRRGGDVPWTAIALVGVIMLVGFGIYRQRKRLQDQGVSEDGGFFNGGDDPAKEGGGSGFSWWWVVLIVVAFFLVGLGVTEFKNKTLPAKMEQESVKAETGAMKILGQIGKKTTRAEQALRRNTNYEGPLGFVSRKWTEFFDWFDTRLYGDRRNFHRARRFIVTFLLFVGGPGLAIYFVFFWGDGETSAPPAPPTPTPPSSDPVGICTSKLSDSNNEVCLSPIGLCSLNVTAPIDFELTSTYGPEIDTINDAEYRAQFPTITNIFPQGTVWPYQRARRMNIAPSAGPSTLKDIYLKVRADYRAAHPNADIVAQTETNPSSIFFYFIPFTSFQFTVTDTSDLAINLTANFDRWRMYIPDGIWQTSGRDDVLPCGCFCDDRPDDRPAYCQSFNCSG